MKGKDWMYTYFVDLTDDYRIVELPHEEKSANEVKKRSVNTINKEELAATLCS